MPDLDKALADIHEIRSRIAAESDFLGLGPMALALSGVLALATAALQTLLLAGAPADPLPYFAAWVATAIAAVLLLGSEMLRRSRRHHSRLADSMIQHAVLQFVPAGVAGAALLAVFARFAPEALWLLPGLWLLLVSLGIFASARSLPRQMVLAGAWYFLSGFTVLMLAAADHALSPWSMGLPFFVGQLLVAFIVHRASEANHVRQ